MNSKRPETGFERLLTALGQDLIDASDQEVLETVREIGLKPGMKGSVALFGVTFGVRRENGKRPAIKVKRHSTAEATRARRPKGDDSSST